MYMKNNYVDTDNGAFSQNFEPSNKISIEKIDTENSYEENVNTYFTIEIYASKNYSKYLRTYIRFYDIFENGCIFFTWISLIVKFFYDYYNEFKFGIFLYSKMMRSDPPGEDDDGYENDEDCEKNNKQKTFIDMFKEPFKNIMKGNKESSSISVEKEDQKKDNLLDSEKTSIL